MDFKELGPNIPQNSVREAKFPGVLDIKISNTTNRTKVLTLPQREETSTRVGGGDHKHKQATKRKGDEGGIKIVK